MNIYTQTQDESAQGRFGVRYLGGGRLLPCTPAKFGLEAFCIEILRDASIKG